CARDLPNTIHQYFDSW
nr:immunoglobulin heavy chain junction region [Macaca mulatta]MOY18000.1 immunoglobulin heavy chain junction region [Macaca mulatta]MOY18008.1 immunoglobulin heavy chain junction region [Macaca mulatta]MOY18025.1 immunoglobulin heavy chain junction region [Macaca mulatta]MOY18077.1 immunoglobulin heavy chain junction region [Macaca mulatta]